MSNLKETKVLAINLPAFHQVPENAYYMEHDLWLASVSELYFNVKLIDKPLIIYKRHGNNVSDGGFQKGYSLPVKLKKRLYRLACLAKIAKKVRKIKKEKCLI